MTEGLSSSLPFSPQMILNCALYIFSLMCRALKALPKDLLWNVYLYLEDYSQVVNWLKSYHGALHCYSEQQSWHKFCFGFCRDLFHVFTRSFILTCQLKMYFLLIAFFAKALFGWQIKKAVLKSNISPKLPIDPSKENSSFEIYVWFTECPLEIRPGSCSCWKVRCSV